MPKLSAHSSSELTKLLLVADSGAGKTGLHASLVRAGYKLRFIDFDNGLDYLANKLAGEDPALLDNVSFATCTDKLKSVGGKAVPDGAPKAIDNALKYMTHWKVPTGEKDSAGKTIYEDLGKPAEWGPDCVLVIDSLTMMCNAAMRYVLFMNGRSNSHPQIQDWGQAMDMVEGALQLLYSSAFATNVVVTSHIKVEYNEDGNALRMYPSAMGKKLPPLIGRYFNSVLTIKRTGTGANEKRKIATVSQGLLECKSSAPKVPSELPIDTGLADYFKAVRGAGKPKTAT